MRALLKQTEEGMREGEREEASVLGILFLYSHDDGMVVMVQNAKRFVGRKLGVSASESEICVEEHLVF